MNSIKNNLRYILISTSFLGVLLVLLGGMYILSYINDDGGEISDVVVTNITSNSASISWTTEDPVIGQILYSQDSSKANFIDKLGKEVAFDDSDYDNEGVYNPEKKKYHHITIEGLEPETEYYFWVGGTKKYVEVEDNLKFITLSISEVIEVPDTVYGKVFNLNRNASDPGQGIVYYQLYNPGELQISSALYSAPINETAGWAGILNNLTTDKGEEFSIQEDTIIKIKVISDIGEKETKFDLKQTHPLPSIFISSDKNNESGSGDTTLGLVDESEPEVSCPEGQCEAGGGCYQTGWCCADNPQTQRTYICDEGEWVDVGPMSSSSNLTQPDDSCPSGEIQPCEEDYVESCNADGELGTRECHKEGESPCGVSGPSCSWDPAKSSCGECKRKDEDKRQSTAPDLLQQYKVKQEQKSNFQAVASQSNPYSPSVTFSDFSCDVLFEVYFPGCSSSLDSASDISEDSDEDDNTDIDDEDTDEPSDSDDSDDDVPFFDDGSGNNILGTQDNQNPTKELECENGVDDDEDGLVDYDDPDCEEDNDSDNDDGSVDEDGNKSCKYTVDGKSVTVKYRDGNGYSITPSGVLDSCKPDDIPSGGASSGWEESFEIAKKLIEKQFGIDSDVSFVPIDCAAGIGANICDKMNPGWYCFSAGDGTVYCDVNKGDPDVPLVNFMMHEITHQHQYKADGYGNYYSNCQDRLDELGAELVSDGGGRYAFLDTSGTYYESGEPILAAMADKTGASASDIRAAITGANPEGYRELHEQGVNLCSYSFRWGGRRDVNPAFAGLEGGSRFNRIVRRVVASSDEDGVVSMPASIAYALNINSDLKDSLRLEPGFYSFTSKSGAINLTNQSLIIPDIKNTTKVDFNFFADLNEDGVKQDTEPLLSNAEFFEAEKESDISSYNIKQGWNLVGFYIKSEDWDTASELLTFVNNIGFEITQIASYEGGGWNIFSLRFDNDGGAVTYGEDFQIEPGRGYFIKSLNSGLLNLPGDDYTDSIDVEMVHGWNLVNFVVEEDLTALILSEMCKRQEMDCAQISRFRDGQYQSFVYEGESEYGEDYRLYEREGYFVKVESEGSSKLTL